jgi:hypothetical protein
VLEISYGSLSDTKSVLLVPARALSSWVIMRIHILERVYAACSRDHENPPTHTSSFQALYGSVVVQQMNRSCFGTHGSWHTLLLHTRAQKATAVSHAKAQNRLQATNPTGKNVGDMFGVVTSYEEPAVAPGSHAARQRGPGARTSPHATSSCSQMFRMNRRDILVPSRSPMEHGRHAS